MGERTDAAAAAPSTSVSAPIGAVSRAALQEALVELSASARSTTQASASALRRLRQDAEKSLGLEVKIEDPALRDLFGHLLQVEALLFQLRQQAIGLQEAAASFAEGSGGTWQGLLKRRGSQGSGTSPTTPQDKSPSPSASSHTTGPETLAMKLGGLALAANEPREDLGPALDKAVQTVMWQTLSKSPNTGGCGSARYRLERRLQEEVLQCVDSQLQQHEQLRDQIRERERWKETAEQSQQELVALKRGPQTFSSFFAAASRTAVRADALQETLQEAHAKMAAIDTDVLSQLLEIKAEARSLIAKPGAALARIRCEFFAEMVSSWATVATDLGARQRSLQARTHAPRPAEGFGSGGVVVSSAPPVSSPTTTEATPASRPKETLTQEETPLAAQLLRSVSSPKMKSPEEASPESDAVVAEVTARDCDPSMSGEPLRISLKAVTAETAHASVEDSPLANADELRKMMSLIAAENGGNVEAVLQDHIAKPERGGHKTADDKLYAAMTGDDDMEDQGGQEGPPAPAILACEDEEDTNLEQMSAPGRSKEPPAAASPASEAKEDAQLEQLSAPVESKEPKPEEVSADAEALPSVALPAGEEDAKLEQLSAAVESKDAEPDDISGGAEVVISSDGEQTAVT